MSFKREAAFDDSAGTSEIPVETGMTLFIRNDGRQGRRLIHATTGTCLAKDPKNSAIKSTCQYGNKFASRPAIRGKTADCHIIGDVNAP
jgi:hypothetical protein